MCSVGKHVYRWTHFTFNEICDIWCPFFSISLRRRQPQDIHSRTKQNKFKLGPFFLDVTCDIVFRLVTPTYLRHCFMNFLKCNFLQPTELKWMLHNLNEAMCVRSAVDLAIFFPQNIVKRSELCYMMVMAHSNVWIGKLGHKSPYASSESFKTHTSMAFNTFFSKK